MLDKTKINFVFVRNDHSDNKYTWNILGYLTLNIQHFVKKYFRYKIMI
jgi:hypothetical protein